MILGINAVIIGAVIIGTDVIIGAKNSVLNFLNKNFI